jgi:predicted TIM-barrel fold metal-dependent hydrolase
VSLDGVPVVDASVHPMVRHAGELLEYMEEPWRSRAYPGLDRYLYPAPTGVPPYGEYLESARSDDGLPASDPDRVWAHLEAQGVDRAILLPLTRGLIGVELGNEICSATNAWLADRWLDRGDTHDRYFGTIRVNPEDPAAAVREVERWAGNPKMVQIGLPLASHMAYGQRFYHPLWEAAVAHSLPVVIHRDTGVGREFYPTPNGYPVFHIEYDTMYPLNFLYHLASLVAEGVLERFPTLQFVFADGGHDLVTPLMWRMDMDWIASRVEIPWVTRWPSEYVPGQVRFVTSPLEGPPPGADVDAWVELSRASDLLLYGSSYPHWSTLAPADTLPGADTATRAAVLGANAARTYRLDRAAAPT